MRGSHNPGQEKAPAAWRAAGLIGELRAAGLDVEDRGDLPVTPYRPLEPAGDIRAGLVGVQIIEVAGRERAQSQPDGLNGVFRAEHWPMVAGSQ